MGDVEGLAAGIVIAEIRRRLDDPPVEATVSLVSAYAAYIPAEQVGASAVLAAVSCGLYLGWRGPEIASPRARLQAQGMWETLIFLLNALLFVLVGLQLRNIVDGLSGYSTATLIGYAAAISAVVMACRPVWMFTVTVVIRTLDRRESQRARRSDWRTRIVGSWSGMRGSVSLAAALAIPFTTDGHLFPKRDLIIFLTFSVILATRDPGVDARRHGRADARGLQLPAAPVRSARGEGGGRRLRGAQLHLPADGPGGDRGPAPRARAPRNQGEISAEVMHRLERELDLEADRLEI